MLLVMLFVLYLTTKDTYLHTLIYLFRKVKLYGFCMSNKKDDAFVTHGAMAFIQSVRPSDSLCAIQ